MAAQNAFKDKANETLEEKALRVCEVIVSCGLGIRGGQITNGEEMVRVERAVNSVDLYILNVVTAGISDIKKHLDAVSLINAMHGYLISKEKDKIEIAANFARVLIDEHDWQTDSKPVNYDLNAAGARMASYLEPTGLVAEFVDAFDIGYKSPSTAKPKTPTGAK